MAQLIVAAAGAAVGEALLPASLSFFGGALKFSNFGSSVGWLVGSMGSTLVGGGRNTSGPKLDELRTSMDEHPQPCDEAP